MKIIILCIALAISFNMLLAQRQLDVQGSFANGDTVATIRSNYVGGPTEEIISLYVKASNDPELYGPRGIAGVFEGNVGIYALGTQQAVFGKVEFGTGVTGESDTGNGIAGYSETGDGSYGESNFGYGLHAKSQQGYGLYSEGMTGSLFRGTPIAIELGGANWFSGDDDGVIASKRDLPGSDIFLVSNDAVIIELDNDGGSAGNFEIWNESNQRRFKVDESGNVEAFGYVDANDIRCQGISICNAFSAAMSKIGQQQQQISVLEEKVAAYEALTKRLDTVEALLQKKSKK